MRKSKHTAHDVNAEKKAGDNRVYLGPTNYRDYHLMSTPVWTVVNEFLTDRRLYKIYITRERVIWIFSVGR